MFVSKAGEQGHSSVDATSFVGSVAASAAGHSDGSGASGSLASLPLGAPSPRAG
jgi:hypothetical protein